MRGRERVRFRDVELDDEELGLSFSWLKVLDTYEFLKNLRKI